MNDGIATPFVTFFIAGAVADTVAHSSTSLGSALADLGIGILVGVAVGLGGALLLKLATSRGWSSASYRGIGVLALALMASLIVWFIFGAVLVTALDATTWQTALFAFLALTVVRMAPVAIALVGTRFSLPTIGFIGWFGPRGLASVVFAVFAYDSLEGREAKTVLAAITLTCS